MHNIEWKVEGDKLIVTIDISKESVEAAPPSTSGKTHLVDRIGHASAEPAREVDDSCAQPYGQEIGNAHLRLRADALWPMRVCRSPHEIGGRLRGPMVG